MKYSSILIISVVCMFVSGCSRKQRQIHVERFDNNPIITASLLSGTDGDDINGPSLIKLPDWIPNKLGTYYLYFAHHKGKYIRLAYADDLKGPWKIYDPGTLQINETIGNKSPFPSDESKKRNGVEANDDNVRHIASPDVHIDDVNREIVMYFHTPLNHHGKLGQYTLRAASSDGIHFKADSTVLGISYFRVFDWQGKKYAIARTGKFYRSADGGHTFEEGPNPFDHIQHKENYLRHAAVKVHEGKLFVFYSRIGDMPERILLSEIKLSENWNEWTPTLPTEVVQPEKEYEGANLPLTVSKSGLFWGRTRELRDPAIHVETGADGDKWYVLYSVAGESGIAIGELIFKQ
jgi:hypothetical protein